MGVKWQLSYKQIGRHQEMHPKTLELVPLNYAILINKANTIYRKISKTSNDF